MNWWKHTGHDPVREYVRCQGLWEAMIERREIRETAAQNDRVRVQKVDDDRESSTQAFHVCIQDGSGSRITLECGGFEPVRGDSASLVRQIGSECRSRQERLDTSVPAAPARTDGSFRLGRSG